MAAWISGFKAWFEGLIQLEQPAPPGKPPSTAGRFLLYAFRQIQTVGWISLVISALFATADALMPVVLGMTIDRFIVPTSDQSQLPLWVFASLCVFALVSRPFMVAAVGAFWYLLFHSKYEAMIVRQTHTRMLGQSWSFFQNEFAGRVSNKVMQTGSASRSVLDHMLEAVIYVVMYFSVVIFILAGINFWLMLPVLLWVFAYFGSLWWLIPRFIKRNAAAYGARAEVSGLIVDAYANIQTVQLFASRQAEDDFVLSGMKRAVSKERRAMALILLADIYVELINAVMILCLFGLSLYLWSNSWISAGTLVLVMPLGFKILAMSNWVMNMAASIFGDIGTLQEALETVTQDSDLVDAPDAKPLVVRKGEIVFDHVGFGYGKPVPVVEALSFRVAPGEKIALVGPSGAGKTTITSLLLRLYDLDQGQILIDGQDISQVTLDSLRGSIAMVTQDSALLHRTVAENIAYGRLSASQDEIIGAARRAGAWDFIQDLDDGQGGRGLEARVGERGVKLSGGQRQRIALARVILKDAPIVIFDEATSALDSETEALLQEQLALVSEGKTVITIAHRLSTIQTADRIFVVDAGRIVEQGSHADLLAKAGLYAKLWNRQTATQD